MSLSPLERSCAGIAVLLLRDEMHHRAGPCFVLIRDDGILLITIRQISGFFFFLLPLLLVPEFCMYELIYPSMFFCGFSFLFPLLLGVSLGWQF